MTSTLPKTGNKTASEPINISSAWSYPQCMIKQETKNKQKHYSMTDVSQPWTEYARISGCSINPIHQKSSESCLMNSSKNNRVWLGTIRCLTLSLIRTGARTYQPIFPTRSTWTTPHRLSQGNWCPYTMSPPCWKRIHRVNWRQWGRRRSTLEWKVTHHKRIVLVTG